MLRIAQPLLLTLAMMVYLAGSPSRAQAQEALATSTSIEYRAYVRTFEKPHRQACLILLASCHYNRGGYVLAFREEPDGTWRLIEQKPSFGTEVLTYYSITMTRPYDEVPDTVKVKDAHGTHDVPVKPWVEEK